MTKFPAQSDVVIGIIAPIPHPTHTDTHTGTHTHTHTHTHTQMGSIGSFLLGKVENSKYPEAETWHPESIDGWTYCMSL